MKSLILLLVSMPLLFAQNLDSLYKNTEGNLLISSLDGSNEYRAHETLNDSAYIPASTFKIPNTLIGLETGVIDSSTLFAWDSIVRPYEPWNQNHTLKSAFNLSCVWCYQTVAEQLSDSLYLDFLKRFDYGNQQTGDSLTTFWLEGDIRISVREQVEFLRKMYMNELPIETKNIDFLREIMIVERTDSYVLRAKTGWAGETGWFIGSLEVGSDTWLFANHIRITDNSQLALRKSLVIDAFKHLGIIK